MIDNIIAGVKKSETGTCCLQITIYGDDDSELKYLMLQMMGPLYPWRSMHKPVMKVD